MISVIIPDYKNAKYLDFCLKSAIENQVNKNEIIVIIDGIYDGYKSVINKYKSNIKVLTLQENKGLAYALNIGVSQASNDIILIVNEDNIFPKKWDAVIQEILIQDTTLDMNSNIICFNQIEPMPSIYNFTHKDFGSTLETFKYADFLEFEINKIREAPITDCGITFPFLIQKKIYMGVGGFDLLYNSPFVVDWDFFYKLQLMGCTAERRYDINFYHFVSKSTKQRDNIKSDDYSKIVFNERNAIEIFKYKWGKYPVRKKENNYKITLI